MYPVTNAGYGTNASASIWTHSGPFYRAAAAAAAGNKPNSWPQRASLKSFYYIVICPAVWWAVTLWAMSPYRMLMNWNDKIIMCCWTHPYHVFFFFPFNWFSDAEWGRGEGKIILISRHHSAEFAPPRARRGWFVFFFPVSYFHLPIISPMKKKQTKNAHI